MKTCIEGKENVSEVWSRLKQLVDSEAIIVNEKLTEATHSQCSFNINSSLSTIDCCKDSEYSLFLVFYKDSSMNGHQISFEELLETISDFEVKKQFLYHLWF
jgi:hypothetical protein